MAKPKTQSDKRMSDLSKTQEVLYQKEFKKADSTKKIQQIQER